MTLLKYRSIKFGADRMEMIDQANAILDEYGAQGLDMTLRQLYYQFVARGLFANEDRNYGLLQRVISDGRLAGLVSWDAIQDRTRTLLGAGAFYNSPALAISSVADGYSKDLWADQDWRPEVWVEKEAQLGNISRVCNELRIQYFASRGYNSQSEQWRAGQRFADMVRRGQRPIVFDLRDHDPSGVHMTTDNRERLEMFAGVPVIVQRLALNMDQVLEVNPPPNPAKLTDSRVAGYVEYMEGLGHGDLSDTSWELDALSPTYIRDLITGAVNMVRDQSRWENALALEISEREYLQHLVDTLEGGTEDDDED